MITLKLASYSPKEIAKLAELLKRAELSLCNNIYTTACRQCEFRHVCYDLMSAREHAEKVAWSGKENEK